MICRALYRLTAVAIKVNDNTEVYYQNPFPLMTTPWRRIRARGGTSE